MSFTRKVDTVTTGKYANKRRSKSFDGSTFYGLEPLEPLVRYLKICHNLEGMSKSENPKALKVLWGEAVTGWV